MILKSVFEFLKIEEFEGFIQKTTNFKRCLSNSSPKCLEKMILIETNAFFSLHELKFQHQHTNLHD